MSFFNIIANTGNGAVQDVLQEQLTGYGQARISAQVNALNGNLVLQGAVRPFICRGFKLQAGMIYNAQADILWKLSLGKTIQISEKGEPEIMTEDGSKIKFKFNKTKNAYVAIGLENGALELKRNGDGWQFFDPGNGNIDFYDNNNKLTISKTPDGNTLVYQYDDRGRLEAIIADADQQIKIKYSGQANHQRIDICFCENSKETLETSYNMDNKGRLLKTSIPISGDDVYEINYKYQAGTTCLKSVLQSDQSEMHFEIEAETKKLQSISDGENRKHKLNYFDGCTEFQDPRGCKKKYYKTLSQKLAYMLNELGEKTEYLYDADERVEQINFADKSCHKKQYDDMGMIAEIQDREGAKVTYKRERNTGLLLNKTVFVVKNGITQAQTSYYIHNQKRQLKYMVEPNGQLTAYKHDILGNINQCKKYLKDSYSVNGLTPDDMLFLNHLEEWEQQHQSSEISITDLESNQRGQVTREKQYANTNNKGQCVEDAQVSETECKWDIFGKLKYNKTVLSRLEDGSPVEFAEQKYEHDGLQRLTEETDPLKHVTTYQYQGRQCIKTNMATGLVEIDHHDRAGNVSDTLEINDNTIRHTHYSLNNMGKPRNITSPGGQKEFIAYDAKGREVYLLDAEGYLREFIYDLNDNRSQVIIYKNKVAAPTEQDLIKGLWTPDKGEIASIHRFIYDSLGRIGFDIDEENYVVEFCYDQAGNLTDKIAYAEPIKNLSADARFCLDVDHPDNQHHRYFYNESNFLIGEQLPCGQVISYLRDQQAAILKKNLHVTIHKPILSWDASLLMACPHDQQTSYERDNKGDLLKEKDAEGYVSEYKRDAAGRKIKYMRGQQEVNYQYDKINRESRQEHQNGLIIEKSYHFSGKIRKNHSYNKNIPNESRCDNYKYNGFSQKISKIHSDQPLLNNARHVSVNQTLLNLVISEINNGNEKVDFFQVITKALQTKLSRNDVRSLLNFMSEQVSNIRKSQADHVDLEEQAMIVSCYSSLLQKTIQQESWPVGFLGGSLLIDFSDKSILPHIDILPHHIKDIYYKAKEITKNKNNANQKIQSILDETLQSLQHAAINPHEKRDSSTEEFYKAQLAVLELDSNQKIKDEEITRYDHDGLKLADINPAGGIRYYYYDKLKRERLIISAEGRVEEKIYDDGSAKPEMIKKYYYKLSNEALENLQGGYVDEDIIEAISGMADKERDVEEKLGYDKRKLLNLHADGEGYTKSQKHDAFRRVIEKSTLIEKEGAEKEAVKRTDAFKYDKKDREVESRLDVDGINAVDIHQFDDANGKLTHVNPEGESEEAFNDRLGRQIRHLDCNNNQTEQAWDEHDRITSETKANNQVTVCEYDDIKGSVEEHFVSGSKIIRQNAFAEKASESEIINGEEIASSWIRDNKGRIFELHEQAGVTRFYYNDLDQVDYTINAEGVITQYEYDSDGLAKRQVTDPGGLCIVTEFERDGLGRVTAEIDANGIRTEFTLDCRGLAICTIVDPNGLGKQILKSFNGLQRKTSLTIGDNKGNPDQYKEVYEQDKIGNRLSKTVDPDGLNIKKSYHHDKLSRLVKEVDPNCMPRWCAYDEFNHTLFDARVLRVLENGDYQLAVTETRRTNTGKISYLRCYALPITIPAHQGAISKEQFFSLLSESKHDQLTSYIYDNADRPKYELKWLWDAENQVNQALVTEKFYDDISQEVKHRKYETALLGHELQGVNKDNIADLIAFIKDEGKDRIVHHVYNKQKQEQFTIHADGSIYETAYDALGRNIAEHQYEYRISKEELKALDQDYSLASGLAQYRGNSRDKYNIWDSLNRKIFTVKPNGQVIGRVFDGIGNKTQICRFNKTLNIKVAHYQNLLTQLNDFIPDETRDTIYKRKFDTNGEITEKIDPLGYKDIFERDVMGGLRKHTNRTGHTTKFKIDRARRLTHEISPETTIAVVKNEGDKLAYTTEKTRVVKRNVLDKAGNINKLILAEGREESRSVNFGIDSQRNITNLTVENVLVDKKVDGKSSGENETVTLERNIVYNTQGKKIAEQNEAGLWDFYIYDNLGNLLYKIEKQQKVTKYKIDSFGQITDEYQYATARHIDPARFLNQALRDEMIAELTILPKTEEDRVKNLEYFDSGKLKSVKTSKVMFFDDGKIGFAQPETVFKYNVFGEEVYSAQLISPGKWAEKCTWRDAMGRVAIEVDETRHITYYIRDAHGNITDRIEYKNPLEIVLSVDLTAEQVLQAVKENPELDRHYVYEYSLRGEKIKERLLNEKTQELKRDDAGKPSMQDKDNAFIGKEFEYSATEKLTKTIYEDGGETNQYYDERDIRIAETDVLRKGKNEVD